VPRASRAACRPRRRDGLHRRRRAHARGRPARAGAAEPDSGNRRGQSTGARAAERDYGRSSGRGGAQGIVLSAGSRKFAAVRHRRERGRMRGRPARVQVRHHQALRHGAGGRPSDRRDHPHGIQGGQERGWVRPDATAGRLRRDACDHHGGDPSSRAETRHATRAKRARRIGEERKPP